MTFAKDRRIDQDVSSMTANTSILNRQSNIELLRIVAMLMIILHHLTVHCIYPELTDAASITKFDNGFFSYPLFFKRLLILETLMPLGKTADCIFMLVTGYFLVERGKSVNIAKSVRNLVSMIGFATIALMIGSVIYYKRHASDFLVSLQGIRNFNGGWWFAGYYLTVIIIGCLWLNEKLCAMDEKAYLSLLIVLFGACSVSWIGSLINNIADGLRIVVGGYFFIVLEVL